MADKILVADDDPSILLTIASILKEAGYSVESTADGKEAQSSLQKESNRFSLVLLDWEMPEMTGIDLLRWIKEQPEHENLPVIMQTAMDSVDQIREGIEAGAFYYLTKPFGKQVLTSIVNAAINDFHYKQTLIQKLKESENPFSGLVEGRFQFRTPEEAEHLAVWLAHACPVPQFAMGIHEILLNAVEHGNLGITYDEKTKFVTDGVWSEEVKKRLRLPEYLNKFVDVQVEKKPDALVVVVEDQGQGFDYQKYLSFDEARVFDNHGRGIAMAGMVMSLEYLGKGNKVKAKVSIS